MPRFRGIASPQISAVWTHSEAASRGYRGTTCEVTEVHLVTSIGTYLDAPYHFDPDGDDISQLGLDQVVLPGVTLDVRSSAGPERPLAAGVVRELDITGKAVLLHTGWSEHWGEEEYYRHPFVPRSLAQELCAGSPALVGIDTLVIDSAGDPTRPAHTLLLRAGILIVENLTGLGALMGRPFTFFAAPVKVAGAAAFPVHAFAIVGSSSVAASHP